MKLRSTILLILIAGGLYCYLRFYESRQPSTEEAQDMERHVLQLDRDKINGITINNNETRIELRRDASGAWEMQAPVRDRADEAAITELLTSVETLTRETTLEPQKGKDDIRDFGLVKPSVTLLLSGSDAPPEILFGKDTAIEGKEYLRLGNANKVYVVPTDLRNEVTRKADAFRSHAVAQIQATQVIKVEIKTANGEIELRKDHDHWQIVRPVKARGDDAKIADLISQTLAAKVDSFVQQDQAAAANAALGEPQGSVTFTAEGVDKPVTLSLSKPLEKEAQKIYGRLSGREALYLLPKTAAAILDARPDDIRDHHLIRLNLDIVDRIHVIPAVGREVVLARKGEEWTIKSLGDRPADGGTVRKVASALQEQLVTAFVSDVATDLPRYGLDRPRLQVTFSSYASENTAETKAGEQALETIAFGNIDGDNVYAKLNDEPFIVSVPRTILAGIHPDALQWQDLAIFKYDGIDSLQVTRDGEAALSLVSEKGKWKPAKGDIAIDGANAQRIASTLATLRATEWAGPAQPAYGLDKPSLTISLGTSDNKTATLVIGAPVNDRWYATASGHDGVFLISRFDHDALSASLLPKAAASPAPSAGVITGS